jgi:phage gp29-like protein
MSTNNYLPQAIGPFREWVIGFFITLALIYDQLLIPKEAYEALLLNKTVWDNADTAAENPTTATVHVINERRRVMRVFTSQIRAFVSEYVSHNHLLTPLQRANLGLLPVNPPSPMPPPTRVPRVSFDTSVPGQITVTCSGSEETRWGMEIGVHGYEWCWAILPAPPKDISELTNSEFSTRAHHTRTFTLGQRGGTLYCIFRWENEKGEKGPWTEIFTVIIP